MVKAILVTGTPGSGKTVFSKRLAAELGAEYISLAEYAARRKLYIGFDLRRKSKIIDLVKTRKDLNNMLSRATKPVVLDTHVSDGILPKKTTRQVFVLRCHPRILERRLLAKKWKPDKIRENVLAEILDSCLVGSVNYYGREKIAQLDTSRASVRQCVTSAKRVLARKRRVKGFTLDWLAKLEKEGLLEKYLD